jgi:hypothetical protein
MREWRYTPIILLILHQLEVSGQLHVLAALAWRKNRVTAIG